VTKPGSTDSRNEASTDDRWIQAEARTAQEIGITRVYEAPRERVWRAWTEPAEIARWWGKRGWSTPPESVTLDVRPGGTFRLNSISDADASEMPLDAVYREVVEPERLVFGAGDRVATVTFTDIGDGRTEMTFHTTILASDELRARAEAGMRSAFDRLAESLTHDDSKEHHVSTKTSIVTGVDFVSIPSRDLAAAAEFYGNVLGLEESSRWQRPGQEPLGIEFETGTVTLALMAPEQVGIPFQPHKVPIALQVDDVAAARAELEARGVEFKGETIDSGVCHQAIFEDPDGNVLDLHHRYAPREPRS
jgi:uncharacterized protein YndB with AHSA1/START domain/catechol 2,3-dioxygenase-like lactoylglutathione lyase family enzyme